MHGHGIPITLDLEKISDALLARPIKSFKLTSDGGNTDKVMPLCAEGGQKVGPTSFEIVKTVYMPERDLDILLMHKDWYRE